METDSGSVLKRNSPVEPFPRLLSESTNPEPRDLDLDLAQEFEWCTIQDVPMIELLGSCLTLSTKRSIEIITSFLELLDFGGTVH